MINFDSLLDIIESPIALISNNYLLSNCSKSFSQITGIGNNRMQGKDIFEITTFPWPNDLKNKFTSCLQGHDQTLIANNKGGISYTIKLKPQKIESGDIKGVFMALSSSTANTNTETSISQYNNHIKLINTLPDAVFVLQDGVIKYTNPALCEVSEYSEEELVGADFTKFIAPENIANVVKYYTNRVKENKTPNYYESTAKTKTGKYIPVEVTVIPIEFNDREAWQVILRDISKYKTALNKLAESEEKYRFITETTLDGIIIHKNGVLLDCNQAFLNITGFSRKEAIGANMLSMVPSEKERRKIQEQIQKQHAKPYIAEVARKDGSLYFAELEGHETEFKGEKVRLVSLKDVNERIKTEEKLQKSIQEIKHTRNHYKALIENAPDGVAIINAKQEMVYASPNAARFFGYTEEDAIGQHASKYTHPDDLPLIFETVKKILENPDKAKTIKYRFKRKNGEYRWLETTFTNLLHNPTIEGIVLNFADITDRKKGEEELRKQKDFLWLLIDNMPNQIFWKDKNLVYKGCNKEFADVIGLESPKRIKGKTDFDFIRDNDNSEDYLLWDKKVLESGKPIYNIEEPYLNAKGEEGVVLTSKIPLFDNDKNVDGLLGFCVDITNRKKAEKELKQSEEKFRGLFRHANIGIAIGSPNGTVEEVNQQYLDITGYTESEFIGINYATITHPDDLEIEAHLIEEIIENKRDSYRIEKRWKGKDGEFIWLDSAITSIRNDKGQLERLIALVFDITEKRKATESMNAFFEQPISLHLISSIEGEIVNINAGWENILGFKKEELLGTNFLELVHPDDIEATKKVMKLLEQGETISYFELRGKHKNGHYKNLAWSGIADSYGQQIHAVGNDVTQEKQFKKALLQEKENYEALSENAKHLIIRHQLDGKITYVNAFALELFDIRKELILGADIKSLLPTTKREEHIRSIEEFKSKKLTLKQFELKLELNNGKTKYLDVTGSPIFEDNKLVSVLITAYDNTERKIAEQKTKESQDLLSRFIDHLPDDAWTKDKHGRVTMINNYAKEITLQTEDIIGKTAHDFFPKEVADKLWEMEQQVILSGKPHVAEEKIPSENGYRDKVLTKFPLFNEEGKVSGIGAIAHDITERKKAEREALRSANFANALLKNLSIPTFYKDREGKYTGCNKAFEDFHGLSSQELIGKTVNEVFGSEWALAKRSLDIETLQKQENKVFEFDLLDKEGNEKHVMYSENIIYDENNEASGIIGSFLDISHHVFEEKLKTAQLELMEKSLSQNVSEIIKSFLTEAEKLTQSQISFYHFISDDQENILLQEWSDNTAMNNCKVVDNPEHYPISKAGVWVDCVHERKPVVHNDYESLAHKKGMPEGHAPLVRELVVPVIRGEKVKAIFGVGNKPTNYSEDDTKLIQQLADFAWEIIDRKQAEEEVKSKNELLKLEKEKVLENEEKHRFLFENMTQGVVYHEANGVISYANEAASHVLGLSREQLTGKDSFDPEWRTMREDGSSFPGEEHPAMISLRTGKPVRNEIMAVYSPRKGHHSWINVNSIPKFKKGATKPYQVVAIFEDITKLKENEQQLKESRNQLAKIFEVAPTGIGQVINRVFTDVNPVFCQMLGYTKEELIGKSARMIYPSQEDYDYVGKDKYEQIKKTGTGRVETRFLNEDGTILHIDLASTPIDDGDISKGTIFTALDISESKKYLKQIEKSEKRYRDLFEHTPIALWEEDLSEVIQFLDELKEQGKQIDIQFFTENPKILQSCLSKIKVIDVNKATLISHKAPSKESFYPKLPELFTKNSLNSMTRWLVALAKGNTTFSTDSQTITLNGEVRDTFMKAHLDKETSTIILAVIDTTEQKKAERELKKYQEHLEELVHKRTEALEESNREMEAFSYSVSHDLRAPLRAISGFSKFLIEDYADVLDAEGNRYLNVINENTDKMDKLITDLLKLSRTSRAELKYIELNMKALARSMYMEVATEKEQKDFEFIVNDIPNIKGDSTSIKQLWTNLIGNAVKYSSKSDIKKIEIGTIESKSDFITYYVKDWGAGFNEDFKEKIFETFKRLHKEEDFKGSGIGMAIAKRVIDKHNGKIWAESKENNGAVFYFSLPLRK